VNISEYNQNGKKFVVCDVSEKSVFIPATFHVVDVHLWFPVFSSPLT